MTNGNQILERSVGSQIRGLHPQEIVIDDPLKEFSMTGIQKVTDWFYGDMIPTLHHTASLRMIGTPFTYTDIFSLLASDEYSEVYTVRNYPCLNQNNEPLWPSRWDYDSLMQRKKSRLIEIHKRISLYSYIYWNCFICPRHIDACREAGKKRYSKIKT